MNVQICGLEIKSNKLGNGFKQFLGSFNYLPWKRFTYPVVFPVHTNTFFSMLVTQLVALVEFRLLS